MQQKLLSPKAERKFLRLDTMLDTEMLTETNPMDGSQTLEDNTIEGFWKKVQQDSLMPLVII